MVAPRNGSCGCVRVKPDISATDHSESPCQPVRLLAVTVKRRCDYNGSGGKVPTHHFAPHTPGE